MLILPLYLFSTQTFTESMHSILISLLSYIFFPPLILFTFFHSTLCPYTSLFIPTIVSTNIYQVDGLETQLCISPNIIFHLGTVMSTSITAKYQDHSSRNSHADMYNNA